MRNMLSFSLSIQATYHHPFLQDPPIKESKGSYLKVAQQGTADSRGRNRGGTGGAQQAWSLPEASQGAPGRGEDTRAGWLA